MTVCVTGIGIVSGIGNGVEEHFEALRAGRSRMKRVSLFETHHDVLVSEVGATNAELKQQLGLPADRMVSRTALLGMMAAKEAVLDAGLDVNRSLRIGLVSSTSVGGMDASECFYPGFRGDSRAGRLRQVVMHDCGAITEAIAAYLHIRGMVTTISTACSSAANAILLGCRLVRQDMLDAVVVGGTDALCKFTLNGFASLMILDKEHCRPFDDTRAGLNLGEGAGFLVLQSEATCHRTPYAEIAGYANTNDAYHQTASSPEGDGPYLAMKKALECSGLEAGSIGYINVHGTGTPNNDESEGKAMKRLFGEAIPAFSSTKAFTGHTLGAAGGIEAVFSVLALSRQAVFPNLNFSVPIKGLDLIPVTAYREKSGLQAVMSNSFGFGGNNTSLIFKRCGV